MISALAFGYGVGMAAPESAVSDMRDAVDGYHGPSRRGAAAAPQYSAANAWRGYAAPPPGYGYPPPGAYSQPPARYHAYGSQESDRLARLRAEDHAASCSLHGRQGGNSRHGGYSEPRSAQSPGDDFEGDSDALDPAAEDALSRLQLPDFQVAVSRSALKYVRFLTRTNRGRGLFTSWLKRSGRYQEVVQQELRARNLPEDLIWLAMIESGFDPRAKSPAGAMGMWQFMRATGEVYGLAVTPHVDERKNPIQATRAATHHLSDLYARFGSWDLAFAAYNMGYEQLLRRIDRYGTTDFNELARRRALPSETAAYVPKIVAAALVANNLERYGFSDIKLYKPVHFAELTVPGGTKLKTLAKAAGSSEGELRKLNPHLRRNRTPPGGSYSVFIPPETLSRARAALPAMLQRGGMPFADADVLMPTDLAGLSKDKKSLRAQQHTWSEGENLLSQLPKPKRRSLRSMLRKDGAAAAQDDSIADLAEEFKPKRGDRETVMYRVGTGDTLIGVAKQFVIDVDDLARDNGIDPDEKLREGALLKLMVKRQVLKKWKQRTQRTKRSRKKRSSKKNGKDA